MFIVDFLVYSRLSSGQHAASYTHTGYTNEAEIYEVSMCIGNSKLIGQNAAVHIGQRTEQRTL